MKTSLGSEQRAFTLHVAYLIQHIYAAGYACTFGDAYRDPRSHGAMGLNLSYGRSQSAHKQRLAIDLNLFKDGEYLSTTEAHRQFGEYWKALHKRNRWGGDFNSPDGNHYAKVYKGIA